MGDFPNISNEKLKQLQVETTVSRRTIVKKYKRTSKTVRRRNRRKRSKKAYFKTLRKNRYRRITEDLCAGLEEFTVIDMDMAPMCDLNQLPEEVAEWQKQDQLAYWKSRAITLEIENRMLHQHIRSVYAQQIEYYEDWKEIASKPNNTEIKQVKDPQSDQKKTSKSKKESNTNLDSKPQASSSDDSSILDSVKDREKVLPKTPEGKNRLEEMKKIYGDMAPKIMGMETAIQLNYERLVEETSPIYWPNIPLKL